MITRAVRAAMISPETHGVMPKDVFTCSATEPDCTAQPIPKAVTAVKNAKTAPSHFILSPRSSANIAPPIIIPLLFFTLYFTAIRLSEYLVAMPNTPVSHIHNSAPGPPDAMAVPTPIMFPVPIVEDSAVASAPNWAISPGLPLSRANVSFNPSPSLRWMNPVLKVK